MTTPQSPELYRKVFINGDENNLPKKGIYIANNNDAYGESELVYSEYDESKGNKKYWLEYIDWYLQPIEPSLLPTSEQEKEQEEQKTERQTIMEILNCYTEKDVIDSYKFNSIALDILHSIIPFQPSKTVQPLVNVTSKEIVHALIWYAEKTGRKTSELDDYDVHVCKVAEEYAAAKIQPERTEQGRTAEEILSEVLERLVVFDDMFLKACGNHNSVTPNKALQAMEIYANQFKGRDAITTRDLNEIDKFREERKV